jgi:crotonobetainyl-CoA:carnitine CoA-transferase CaiB-like acyl-CoA transferase
MSIFMAGASVLSASLGMPMPSRPPRTIEIPSIEPTADDYIGFCTITAQQFRDFLVLIEHAELLEDKDLASFVGRQARRDEFLALVHDWTRKRSSADIEELAAAMRIPIAPIGRPETITGFAQFGERQVFRRDPTGRFVQPRPPYLVDDTPSPPVRPSPRLGEHQEGVDWEPHARAIANSNQSDGLPLQGLRIIDLTAFWAGPSATLALAALGAEVIKVESIQRPDGMRFTSAKQPGTDLWWEWGTVYLGNNFNKLGVTLDLTKPEGLEIILELVSRADALIENFSPRVLDNFGLTWERVSAANPRIIMVRMPAFGLSGPWRDRTGFAQTMEQASGMAWMTGFRDGPPVIPRGPCDPLAGMHAAFALLAAVQERDRSDRGHFVESTMVEAALNVAAEMVIEHGAYGATLSRDGNRGPVAAPQGLYRCAGTENWLALAVVTDEHWAALCRVLGEPEWTQRSDLETAAGRRAAHDLIDDYLQPFFATRAVEDTVSALVAAGVPAGAAVEPVDIVSNPQMRARGFIESFDHPVVGTHDAIGMPFRLSSYHGRWFRTPSPTLGQHNRDVLKGLLGMSDARLDELRQAGIVGERPVGT